MAEKCSHKDSSRGTVSSTAHYAAFMRSVEHDSQRKVVNDPFARSLAGEVGLNWYNKKIVEDPDYVLYLQVLFACRTKAIDEAMVNSLAATEVKQICVLGAGLDSRPWRLPGSKDVNYFEVDFPEIFKYKLPVIEKHGRDSEFNYIAVGADLSVPGWVDILHDAGFDSSLPTLWMMEGLTFYLTEEEISAFFQSITLLSNPGSVLIADFISTWGVNSNGASSFSHMFRFTPDQPLDFISQFGWAGNQSTISALADQYGLSFLLPVAFQEKVKGYFVITSNIL